MVSEGLRRLQEQDQYLVWVKKEGSGVVGEGFEEQQDAAAAAILASAACGLQVPAQTQHTVETSYTRKGESACSPQASALLHIW
jgi:hypothetical protein